MVQFFTLPLVALFAISSLATPLKRSAAQIEADIATLSSQLTTLDNAITAFPNTGGSLINALAIHTDSTNVASTVTTTDNHVLATPPLSLTDGTIILNALNATVPTITHALTGIVAKKPAFEALPIGGIPALIKQDLTTLNSVTAKLEADLIDNAPLELVAAATSIKNTIDAAFATAVAAYA